MNFAFPLAFLLFAPLLFTAWRLLRRGRNCGIKFSFSHFVKSGRSHRAVIGQFAPHIMIAALAFLIVALARPRTQLARSSRTVDAISIAMIVDISESMNALDLAPKEVLAGKADFTLEMTRLAVVKKLFAKFVERRPDDLISLVTFGGYAAARVPLTADHAALLSSLKAVAIPPTSVDESGRLIAQDEKMTAVGDGLATALECLKDSKPKSKIAILLSDGVSNTGAVTPEQATAIAAKLGIKVYTIGVGTRAFSTPFVRTDIFGRKTVGMASMAFDEKELKRIARETGGMYFPVNDESALDKALSEIDALEKTTLEADVYDRWDEHFKAFLFLGVALVFIAVTLSMVAYRRLA